MRVLHFSEAHHNNLSQKNNINYDQTFDLIRPFISTNQITTFNGRDKYSFIYIYYYLYKQRMNKILQKETINEM